jgi:hypothetical protein
MSKGRRFSGPTALALVVCLILPCTVSTRAEGAGRVAAPGLRVERATGDELRLTWPGSCLAVDTDFAIYEGVLDDPGGLDWVTCTTGGATAYTYEPADNSFFLVVPRNTTHEGSYGTDGEMAERLPSSLACYPQEISVCPSSMALADIDSGQTSPTGNYRWMDVADQLYSVAYRESYDYTQADVILQFFPTDTLFRGYLVAANLKPHFAYQVKLAGISGTPSNELIGLTGRWWQEEWNGSAWVGGQNLNNKGDGSSPNPNDVVYFSRRDITDPTSPTGYRYRYTGYLPFDYFISDESGNRLLEFEQDSAYHVLWKTSQRAHTAQDGPPEATVTIFGEWERLPVGGVTFPPGIYEADFVLTEESFHGGGLAGGWAAAMGVRISFEIE